MIDGDPLKDIRLLLDRDRVTAVYHRGELVSIEHKDYDPQKVSDFSFANWNNVYTRDRVTECKRD